MSELVQLDRHHDDFAKRNVQVVAASMDNLDDTQHSQTDFPHLTLLSDEARHLSEAAALIHAHAGPDGGDADSPTTILVDRHATVRWVYRPPSVLSRLSPEQVLHAVDQYLR